MNTILENPKTMAVTLFLAVVIYYILQLFFKSIGGGNAKISDQKPKLYCLLEQFTFFFKSPSNSQDSEQTLDDSDKDLDIAVRQSGYYLTIQEIRRTQKIGLGFGIIIGLLVGWFILEIANDGNSPDNLNHTGRQFYLFFVQPGLAGVLGYLLPLEVVLAKAGQRSKAVLAELPFAIDMLASSMDAGLDFSASVRYYLNVMGGSTLNDEFAVFLRDVELGKTRGEALRDMDRRLAVPEFSRFVHAIVYAMENGAPVIDIMRQQVEDIRRAQFSRAEKIIQLIEPKQEAIIAVLAMVSLIVFLGVGGYLQLTQ